MVHYMILVLILLYSITILFYMADLFNLNYFFSKWSFRLLLISGSLQIIVFLAKTLYVGYVPLLTLFEILIFYSLLLIIISIVIHYYFRYKLLEMIIVFLALLTLIGAISTGETFPSISNTLLSKLAFIHILLSLISYIVFSLSAIISILFLLYDYLLKRKMWNKLLKTLPSLEGLERNAYYANLIGEVLLFIGLIVGLVWASLFYDWRLLFDPKVLFSLIVLYMYGIAIVKRQRNSWITKELAVWNIAAFIMVGINFAATYLLDSFHNYL